MYKRRIKINEEELKFIHGSDYDFLQNKILHNCNCDNCESEPYTSQIVDYKITLNRINDIELRGFCAKCKSPIVRYVETGEVKKYLPRINKVRKAHTGSHN